MTLLETSTTKTRSLPKDVQYVVVDCETYKTKHYEGKKLLGVAIAYSYKREMHSDYFLPDELDELYEWLDGKELVFHNAVFDLRILEENGMKMPHDFWDTMIMAHLVNENRFSYELDSLAKAYLKSQKGVVDTYTGKMVEIKQLEKIYGGWEKIPADFMGAYAQQDCELTYRLFTILRGELERQQLMGVWRHSREYILTLKDVIAVGLPIDWTLADAMSQQARAEMLKIAQRLGFHPSKKKALESALFKTFDPQILTAGGGPATDDPALRFYARKYPEVKDLCADTLRYRGLQKADSTWYSGFLKVRTPHDKIHPGLKQHGTVTGRLSCANPNLQQLPRDDTRGVKKLFLPAPGHQLLEFDYSQVELRLAGWYAKEIFDDSVMYDAYYLGMDVHTLTTERVGATDRQVGKTGNFLWVYGGSAKRFRSMMFNQYKTLVSPTDAYSWTNGFHDTYPGFKKCYKHFDNQATNRGYVKLWNGRRRRFRREDTHKAWNSVIQGGCGVILMMGMNRLRKAQEDGRLQGRMCNSVHDSIWFMIPDDRVEEEIPIIKEIMASVPEKLTNLPFEVDVKPVAKYD